MFKERLMCAIKKSVSCGVDKSVRSFQKQPPEGIIKSDVLNSQENTCAGIFF